MTNRFNKVLLASALALGANMKAQANDIQVTDDTKEVVSTTKVKVDGVRDLNNQMGEQGYGVSKDEKGNLILEKNTTSSTISNGDLLSYGINFSVNPTSAFELGDVGDFSKDEISTFKRIPGIRVFKGKLSYTPSKTLDYLKSQKAIYESDLKRVFANNPFIIKHFQFYLNSKLGLSGNTFSGIIDKSTITKTSSVLKNESIFNSFDTVLSSYGSAGLRVFNMNGKTVLVNTNLGDFADKDALAILDMPYFDENGNINFSNEFNELLLDFPTEGFSYIAGLNDNKVRLITSKWLEAVNSKLSNIKYEKFNLEKATTEKQAEQDKIKKELEKSKKAKAGPTILSGAGQLLSGNLSDKSAMGVILKRNALGLNQQDDISLDKVNIKTTLEFIAEATNRGDNSRVAAKLIMLYSMARVGTTIYMEKGDMTAKAGIGATYMTDEGNIIKLDYGFFRQFMEYTFPEVNKKYNLAPEQHGISLSYTQNDIEKFEMLKELTYSLRAFKVETLDMGEVGKLTRDVNNIFEQYKVMGALQGGKKVEAEVNFAFDLGKALSEEMGLMDIRLDVAPRIGYAKYDDVLDIKGESKFGTGLKTKLSTLLFDKTVKASISSDIYTGGIHSFGVELSKKMEFGEATIYAKQDKFGPDANALNSIGIKGTFENPFGLQDDEDRDVPTYASLFNENQRNFKFLTYEQADFDQKLVSGYAIAPKVQIQKIRELMIDRASLPAGSTLDKNNDGTLKQINLNTGVNDLNGTINVAPAAYLSNFSITGTSFITIKNVEKMAVPQVYNIVAGQTSGGSVIMSLTLTKGSVMINQTVKYLAGVPNNLAQDFLNGTKTFEQIQALMAGPDTTPDAFDISNMTNQTLSTAVTTNAITVAGVNTSVTASTTVGTIVKNGTDTGLASTTVVAGDTVAVKLTTSASYSTSTNGTLTVGTVSDNFSVTTEAIDTTPTAFSFTDVTGQALNTLVESSSITVSGINAPSAISVTGGEYSINGGAWTSIAGTVTNGQTIKVRHTTSGVNNTSVNTILTIGGVLDTFTTTTIPVAPDTTPNVFDIVNMTNQVINTVVTTNAITVAGINTSVTASTTLGTIVKNGTDTGSASTTVVAGDTVAVKLTTSASYSTSTNGTLTVGTVIDNFSVTTEAIDTTPGPFTFTDLTNQPLNTIVESNEFTVSGINTSIAISVTGGEYQINGGAWTSIAGTVTNGQTVKVRHTTSSSYSTSVFTSLNIGGVVDTFHTTTIDMPLDTLAPNMTAFSVTGITDTTGQVSATIDEAGTGYYIVQSSALGAPSAAQIMAGQDSSGASAVASGSSAMSANTNHTFNVSGLTPSTNYKVYFIAKDNASTPNVQASPTSLNLNTIATPADTTPDAFDISNMTNQALSTAVTTNAITVSGVSSGVTASTTVGTIVKNGTDTGLSSTTVYNTDTVAVKLTTSASYSTATNGTLTIGTLSDNFSVTTLAADATLPATPTLNINSGATYTNSTSVGISITGDTDNVGVTGWYVSETTSSIPTGGSWSSTKPTSASISSGDGTKTLKVWTKDAAGNVSLAGSDTIILDAIAPSSMSFSGTVPDTKNTQYNGLILNLGEDLTGGTLTNLTSSTGGTISGQTISGGNVAFDWLTPNAGGSQLRAQGTDRAGNPFDVTLNISLPN